MIINDPINGRQVIIDTSRHGMTRRVVRPWSLVRWYSEFQSAHLAPMENCTLGYWQRADGTLWYGTYGDTIGTVGRPYWLLGGTYSDNASNNCNPGTAQYGSIQPTGGIWFNRALRNNGLAQITQF